VAAAVEHRLSRGVRPAIARDPRTGHDLGPWAAQLIAADPEFIGGRMVDLMFEVQDVVTSVRALGNDDPVLEAPLPSLVPGFDFTLEVPLSGGEDGHASPPLALCIAPGTPSLIGGWALDAPEQDERPGGGDGSGRSAGRVPEMATLFPGRHGQVPRIVGPLRPVLNRGFTRRACYDRRLQRPGRGLPARAALKPPNLEFLFPHGVRDSSRRTPAPGVTP